MMEMALEYKKSGEKCRRRLAELNELLRNCELTESQRVMLRRRMAIIDSMARDASSISKYLGRYYAGEGEKA